MRLMGRLFQAPIMFAFSYCIGVVAKSFRLFLKKHFLLA